MKKRLPLILSMTALVVSVLGTTPLGHAAGSAVSAVVPLAKTANWAKNAGKLNGHTSSRVPRVGQIPVVGTNGKLPATLGAVGPPGPAGPKGDAGAKGDPGAAGVAGYQRVQQQQETPRTGERAYTVPCPGGKSVLGGGFNFSKGKDTDNDLTMIESTAASDSVWEFKLRNRTGQRPEGAITLSVVCATVNS